MSLPPEAGAFGSTWAERFVEHCDSFCHPGATGGFGGENVVPCSVEVISSMNTSYIVTGKPPSLPAPTSPTSPKIKKHCVLWDKMHMSVILAFILQRTA